MRALDSVLSGRPCTYLKMDVEGAEREAIAGAEKTIRQYAPKLNIAAYHRSEDFFQLPLLIHALQPSYRLYLRHHPYVTGVGYEFVCHIKKQWKSRSGRCIIKIDYGRV